MTGYRPGAELVVSLLPSRDGALKALSFKAYADTGAAVNSTIAALARLIYPAEAKELIDHDVVSNLPPGAPFRGPGGPVCASLWSRPSTRRRLGCQLIQSICGDDGIATFNADGFTTGQVVLRSGARGARPGRKTAGTGAASALRLAMALLLATGLSSRTRNQGWQTGC